jgi:hypothetical protein
LLLDTLTLLERRELGKGGRGQGSRRRWDKDESKREGEKRGEEEERKTLMIV